MHDRIIRGGTLVDGTGAPAREADLAIDRGLISEVGRVTGEAREEIDARGLLVTPGFVDIHTHYDGQVTWDELLTPSCWHGVTTVVMGNCGVGFAPVRPGSERWLIGLMEGVEDIPGTALHAGIRFSWETFPQYLDAIERIPRALDVATQVPHGPVRGYVMGERGAHNEPATPEDIAAMAAIVKDAIRAGALGFSTSRTIVHRAVDGEPVPGTFAAEDELFGIGRALRDAGAGLFELAPAGVVGEDLSAAARSRLDAQALGRDPAPRHLRAGRARCRPGAVARGTRARRRGRGRGRESGAPSRLAPDHALDRTPDLPPVRVEAELPQARVAAARRARDRAAQARDARASWPRRGSTSPACSRSSTAT